MMILGQNIDRSQLPTLTMRQMNPSHTYQSMQDLLSAKLGMTQPQPQPAAVQVMEAINNGR